MGCILPKEKTIENIIDKVWELRCVENNVEPYPSETEHIEPYQMKGQLCRILLTSRCYLECASTRYQFEKGTVTRLIYDKKVASFPEERFSHIRIILEMLRRFSRESTIARMDVCLLCSEEAEHFAEEFNKIEPDFLKIPVKKLLLRECYKNFRMERFFEYEYLALYRGTQLRKELNTAKFLIVSDKQDDPEEIKKFGGWGLVVMEAEANDFSPEILKDQVTEWLETGNCQYKFLCIFDEKREIIEDSIIKWALSLKGEPAEDSIGNSRANLKKRLVHDEEEGHLYIFQKTCIVFMRGDAICDEFAPLAEIGAPFPVWNSFFFPKENEKIVPFNEEMFP